MSLQLQITAAGFTPSYARETFEYLFGAMIWSADSERRGEFMRTAEATRTIGIAEAVPGRFADRPHELGRIGLDALPPRVFEKEILERLCDGMNVGEYYAIAMRLSMLGQPVSVKSLLAFQTRPERRRLHPRANIGQSTLKELLREYRAAVPLWTAAYALASERPGPLPWWEPLDEFVALAMWIADRLTRIKLERRNKPLFAPGADFWRAPPGLPLPSVTWPDGYRPGAAPLPPTGDLFKLWELIGPTET